jgi:hypothetical protein
MKKFRILCYNHSPANYSDKIMQKNLIHIDSRCPIVKKESRRFVQRINLVNVPVPAMIEFDSEILWLKESESKISLWHNEIHIQDRGIYSDYYGLLSSVEKAIQDAIELKKALKIDDNSSLEIRVECKVDLIPVLKDVTEYQSDIMRRYLALSDEITWFYDNSEVINQYISDMQILAQQENYELRAKTHEMLFNLELKNRTLADKVVLWTSKTDKTDYKNQFVNFYMTINQEQ